MSEHLPSTQVKPMAAYCKLLPVQFPLGFKPPKYRLYDGTQDPHQHLAAFLMDSHQYLHDRVLLVHLFQRSLEGEALHWFISLPAQDLINFEVLSEKFITHFSHLVHQSATIFDLVTEKMKSDEDFFQFANH